MALAPSTLRTADFAAATHFPQHRCTPFSSIFVSALALCTGTSRTLRLANTIAVKPRMRNLPGAKMNEGLKNSRLGGLSPLTGQNARSVSRCGTPCSGRGRGPISRINSENAHHALSIVRGCHPTGKHPPAYAGGSPGTVSRGLRSSKPLGTADLADFCRWRVPFRNRAPRVCSSLSKGLAAGGLRRAQTWIASWAAKARAQRTLR